jgi:hypothetical protein
MRERSGGGRRSCCSRFPAAYSATGLRFLSHPAPAGELSLPHGRSTRRTSRPDPIGVVMLRMSKLRPGRAPALLRGRRCVPDQRLRSDRRLPLSNGQSLHPHWNNPPAGITFTKPQRRFTRFAHPGLLLACGPWAEQGPLGLLPRASHPAVTRDARQGGDRPTRTGPGTTPSTSAEPPQCLPLELKHLHVARNRQWLRARPG